MLRVLLVLLACLMGLDEAASAQFGPVAQFVPMAVTVTGAGGRPVEGLTKNDFTLLEDGKSQKIAVCEFQDLRHAPPPREGPDPEPPPDTMVSVRELTQERPGSRMFSDRRLLVLYFDLSLMTVADQLRAQAAAVKFVRTQMEAVDKVAVLAFYGGDVHVRADFTDDRDLLARTIRDLKPDSEGGLGADLALESLRSVSRLVAGVSERKSLICFGSHLRQRGLNNLSSVQPAVLAAGISNTSISVIDATASPGPGEETAFLRLAAETGGKALLDGGDLSSKIVAVEQAASSYYLLGYYSTNSSKLDGGFRTVAISLKDGGASLGYRRGYYSGIDYRKLRLASTEEALQMLFHMDAPWTDIPVQAEVDSFSLDPDRSRVEVTIRMPGRERSLVRKSGIERTSFDFLGEVTREDKLVESLRDTLEVKMPEVRFQEDPAPIVYHHSFTLAPGAYTLRLIVRNRESGRATVYLTPFTVMSGRAVRGQIPISSVVLGPDITHVFPQGSAMTVSLEAYEPSAQTARQLTARVTLYRGTNKIFETLAVPATGPPDANSHAVPLALQVPLRALSAGEYRCEVTVADPAGKRSARWEAPILIAPER